MYMSRVKINSNNKFWIKNNHVGFFHNWVERSFYSERRNNKEQLSRKLWRIDKLNNEYYLVIVSKNKPDNLEHDENAVKGSSIIKSYDTFIDELKQESVLRFKITLNPVCSIKSDSHDAKRGKVVPHVTIEQQKKFLVDRSIKNGFELLSFNIIERGYVRFKKPSKKDIMLSKAIYEGVLKITDIDKFRNVLVNGLGKKKAYGFGLMTVLPIN